MRRVARATTGWRGSSCSSSRSVWRYSAVDVLELEAQPGELGVVVAPALRDGARELVAQESQPLGAEQAASHELEELVEDQFLLDLKGPRVPGDSPRRCRGSPRSGSGTSWRCAGGCPPSAARTERSACGREARRSVRCAGRGADGSRAGRSRLEPRSGGRAPRRARTAPSGRGARARVQGSTPTAPAVAGRVCRGACRGGPRRCSPCTSGCAASPGSASGSRSGAAPSRPHGCAWAAGGARDRG